MSVFVWYTDETGQKHGREFESLEDAKKFLDERIDLLSEVSIVNANGEEIYIL